MERISVALKLVNKDFNRLNCDAQCTEVFVRFWLEKRHHIDSWSKTCSEHWQDKKQWLLAKSSSNISVVKSHVHIANTGLSLKIHLVCFISYEHHSKWHIIAFLSGHYGLSFISELMMFPCTIHRGLFNETCGVRQEGGEPHWPAFYWEQLEPKWLPSARIFPRRPFIYHRTCTSQENHNTDRKTHSAPH